MQSIQALLDDFTLSLRASRVSENTISAYLGDLNMFFAWLSFNTVDNSSQDFAKTDALALLGTLDQITLRHWMASCTDPKLGNKKTVSLVRSISAIKKLARFAAKVEPYAQNCPDLEWLLLLKAPKVGKRVARALEHVSIGELLDENNVRDWQAARDRALFTLLYASGMRLGEALNLSCAEIELPMITVRGKGRKERRIPMLPIIKQTFDQYRQMCPFAKSPQAPAFVSSRGLRLGPRAVQRRCENKRVKLNLGNDFTPHALRRAFASHLLADGANLRVIQELLGHSSLSTTEKYTAIDESTLVDELRALHPRDQM